jgi:hypothetical protein
MGDPQKFVPWIVGTLAVLFIAALLAESFLATCEWWQGRKKGGKE